MSMQQNITGENHHQAAWSHFKLMSNSNNSLVLPSNPIISPQSLFFFYLLTIVSFLLTIVPNPLFYLLTIVSYLFLFQTCNVTTCSADNKATRRQGLHDPTSTNLPASVPIHSCHGLFYLNYLCSESQLFTLALHSITSVIITAIQ